MSDFTKELKILLRGKGCSFERQGKGDHEIWFSPITNLKFVVDNKIKSRILQMLSLNRRVCQRNSNETLNLNRQDAMHAKKKNYILKI